MNILQYIESRPELAVLNFRAVYTTITTLIGDGIISMDDFPRAEEEPKESNRG